MSRSTVQKAVGEVDAGVEVSARIRPPGAGRPKAIDAQPGLLVALDDLVEPRRPPMMGLKMTSAQNSRCAPIFVRETQTDPVLVPFSRLLGPEARKTPAT
jgi:hypothetical protein